jgi:hypothetical protein
MAQEFGDRYRSYMTNTKRLNPGVFQVPAAISLAHRRHRLSGPWPPARA